MLKFIAKDLNSDNTATFTAKDYEHAKIAATALLGFSSRMRITQRKTGEVNEPGIFACYRVQAFDNTVHHAGHEYYLEVQA